MKKNFDILKKQTRFYIFMILLVATICGFIFKGMYAVQYNKTLHNMQNEPKYTSQLQVCRNIFLTFPILQDFQPIH